MEFTRTLRKGMSGEDVALAKARLFELGCYDPKITSIKKDSFGSDTVAAVRRFQNKNGLQVDGIIGAETRSVLFGNEISEPVISDSTLLDTILNLCDEQVDNESLFVWASSGELGTKVNEATIRKREARSNGGSHADKAVEMWERRLSQGNTVFRIFDCSGFVSWILSQGGVFKGRRDCDGLFSLCTKISKPVNGALLFRVNKENSEDETHVGLYFNGYQYHAKGRDYGVVKEKYKASDWAKIGKFSAITYDESTETEISEPVISISTVKPPYVLVLGNSVNVRNGGSVKYDIAGTAHKGDKFPYVGTDKSDMQWYMIEFEDMTAFISSNPKYTKLVHA